MTDVHLTQGAHNSPDDGMCVMEYVSWKYGLGFTDLPTCTEKSIALAAQRVNDRLGDEDRQRLALRADRLFDAKPVRDPEKRKRVLVRVSCWSARSVLHLVDESRREVALRAIETAEAWLRGDASVEDCRAAYVAADAAAYAAAAADAATEIDLVDWLDDLLDQYDKARAAEGVMAEAEA